MTLYCSDSGLNRLRRIMLTIMHIANADMKDPNPPINSNPS
ncbi:MAG: hypothetical protein GQ523_01580 [Methanophagales archaeon]|nr:hypothetical protein [Methanophagales archaeon]